VQKFLGKKKSLYFPELKIAEDGETSVYVEEGNEMNLEI
jgi:hypothetical protein